MRFLKLLATSLLVCSWAAAAEPPAQTLCVLDFNRLGDDASMDWLQEGLADMIIGTMNGLGPYQVIERQYLKEILREHGLATTGLVDSDTAIRQARLAKAQLLLLGSFARQGDRLTIQVRLMRISGQQILARVTWRDPYAKVLSAPRDLSERLLVALGNRVDPGQLEGIEKEIPRTIDVAKSYYQGIRRSTPESGTRRTSHSGQDSAAQSLQLPFSQDCGRTEQAGIQNTLRLALAASVCSGHDQLRM